jgi:hypothetical protein
MIFRLKGVINGFVCRWITPPLLDKGEGGDTPIQYIL